MGSELYKRSNGGGGSNPAVSLDVLSTEERKRIDDHIRKEAAEQAYWGYKRYSFIATQTCIIMLVFLAVIGAFAALGLYYGNRHSIDVTRYCVLFSLDSAPNSPLLVGAFAADAHERQFRWNFVFTELSHSLLKLELVKNPSTVVRDFGANLANKNGLDADDQLLNDVRNKPYLYSLHAKLSASVTMNVTLGAACPTSDPEAV